MKGGDECVLPRQVTGWSPTVLECDGAYLQRADPTDNTRPVILTTRPKLLEAGVPDTTTRYSGLGEDYGRKSTALHAIAYVGAAYTKAQSDRRRYAAPQSSNRSVSRKF